MNQSNDDKSLFVEEWKLLQNQFDAYEKFSLLIKLAALLCFAWLLGRLYWPYSSFLLGCFWLLDAIWKTFQARIERRLLQIEASLDPETARAEATEQKPLVPMQFNRDFAKQRSGLVSLVQEYVQSALKPTVAFPYPLLILMQCGLVFYMK